MPIHTARIELHHKPTAGCSWSEHCLTINVSENYQPLGTIYLFKSHHPDFKEYGRHLAVAIEAARLAHTSGGNMLERERVLEALDDIKALIHQRRFPEMEVPK